MQGDEQRARRRTGRISNSATATEQHMSTFDKREEGFEAKFAHDEELRFKARAHRNKLVGLWAAEKLGLVGAAAETYATNVVTADLDKPDSDSMLNTLSLSGLSRSAVTTFVA